MSPHFSRAKSPNNTRRWELPWERIFRMLTPVFRGWHTSTRRSVREWCQTPGQHWPGALHGPLVRFGLGATLEVPPYVENRDAAPVVHGRASRPVSAAVNSSRVASMSAGASQTSASTSAY